MLKTYWPMLVLFLALLTILGVSCYTYPCDECQQDSATHSTLAVGVQAKPNDSGPKANHAERAKFWIMKTIAWPDGVTALLILLTLLGITWQSCETRKAAEATQNSVVTAGKSLALQEKMAKSQLRAYLGIPEGRLCIFADGCVEPRLTFKNCGQTPAYELEVETCGRFESRRDQYLPPRRDPGLHPHRHIVGGGSPYHFTCNKVQSGREKDVLLNDLASGHLAFRLYGKCTYRDAFKDPHFIDFQLFVGGGAIVQYTTDPDKGSLTMLTDSKGNSAD